MNKKKFTDAASWHGIPLKMLTRDKLLDALFEQYMELSLAYHMGGKGLKEAVEAELKKQGFLQ